MPFELKVIRIALPILALLMPLGVWSAEAQQPSVVTAADQVDLSRRARSVRRGQGMHLKGLRLDRRTGSVDLELERFRPFAPGARIVLHDGETQRSVRTPDNAYFRGWVEGDKKSLALLTVREAGGMRGIVAQNDQLWVVGGGPGTRGPAVGLATRAVDKNSEFAQMTEGWSCDVEAAPEESPLPAELLKGIGLAEVPVAGAPGVSYTAHLAIETDTEFYNLFGNVADAVDYVGDLIAYGSTIYANEVDTSWAIETINLYSSGSDPWGSGDYNGDGKTNCTDRLYELRDDWNANHTDVDRTLVHMLSGKSTGCGIAYLSVLCDQQRGYGFTGSLRGNFNIDSPAAVWDMVAVAHEIGHNFSSPHTHDYCGIGGNAEPVDECAPAQYGGACSGTSGQLPPSPCLGPGNACGTIMSYCHLISGGMGNIALSLGLGHPYGVEAFRVPERMLTHVASRASSNATCLAPIVETGPIFSDGFESGDVLDWDRSLPPIP